MEEANRLADGMGTPVSVRDICYSLGIKIRRSETSDHTVLSVTSSPPEIVLAAHLRPHSRRWFPKYAGSALEARDRYAVAHELGHYLLLRAGSPMPLGRAEYFVVEDLCNEFASVLLVPDRVAKAAVAGATCSIDSSHIAQLRAWLALSRRLQNIACVPWQTVVSRLHAINSNIWFLTVVKGDDGRLTIVASTLKNKGDLRRVIGPTTPLGGVLESLSVGSISEVGEAHLSPLKSGSNAIGAVAHRVSNSVTHLALCGATGRQVPQ
jgi:hypothetical protein